MADVGDVAKAADKLTQAKTQLHHVCMDKNCISATNGGPWTPQFKEFFDGAGLDITKSLDNLVNVPGHKGPHPQAYHQYVYDNLKQLHVEYLKEPKHTPSL